VNLERAECLAVSQTIRRTKMDQNVRGLYTNRSTLSVWNEDDSDDVRHLRSLY
jgi:hypothetical protein